MPRTLGHDLTATSHTLVTEPRCASHSWGKGRARSMQGPPSALAPTNPVLKSQR
jgi:hypothetical protein